MTLSRKPELQVVYGTKEILEKQKRRLGEQAELIGTQWGNGQIGPRGQIRLIEAFRELMPGIAVSIVQIAGPAILVALGEQAIAGRTDTEGIAFLSHVLPPAKSVKTRIAEATVEGELQKIRRDLKLISEDWSLVVDSEGHYVDVVGAPRMPTRAEFADDAIVPEYDQVNVATIYLEEPGNELRLNAEFIAQAPRRIEWLLSLLDQSAGH